MITENQNEKTLKISQEYLKYSLPKYNSDNIFDLTLPDKSPFHIDYTRNGKYLLLGGEKGSISLIEWRTKQLLCDFETETKLTSVKFLHNETMYAVGQSDMVYIYDKQSLALHALDYMPQLLFLEYLPYHYLLVAALKNNVIKYQDISIGKVISEIKTKSGIISSFTQNPHNATTQSSSLDIQMA